MPTREQRLQVKWKMVPGFPGYRVSSAGGVESCRERGPGDYLTAEWSPLAVRLNRDGYQEVHIHANGIGVTARVNTLVLLAFVGPKPEGTQSCHRNGQRADNRLANLRWGTSQSNIDDRELHGTTARRERNGRAKLTGEKVAEIKTLKGAGATYAGIAARFGISKRQVGRILKGKSWAK